MSSEYYLGIDLGTVSTCLAYANEEGKVEISLRTCKQDRQTIDVNLAPEAIMDLRSRLYEELRQSAAGVR